MHAVRHSRLHLPERHITGGETWVAQPDPAIGGGQELQGEAEYQCPTGNVSGFMAETDGYLWDSMGTEYTASAADPGVGEFTRYNCG
ncbi:hypothetical protein GCM10007170_40480 [Arthrobacter liuii]|uniref:Uncharacterized protein n=1 Tax=Arthrobacter liuii TaxID=1476996 RepID=A0ABQ2AXJ8_9MICC|nr:hypothetical protein GCM10007170_40480 [Arthrobacter liuii]